MSKNKKPTHQRLHTRKYQCNGLISWSPRFRELAELVGGKGAAEGVGIRAALYFAMTRAPSEVAAAAKLLGKDGDVRAVDLVPEPKAAAKKAPKAVAKAVAK